MNFYLAFSIHGTNKFRVFTKSASSCEELGKGFSVDASRRPGYNINKDGLKVHWTGLLTKDGKPMVSPSWVHRRLRALVAEGWTEVTPRADSEGVVKP